MKENVELNNDVKKRLKVIAAQNDTTMKQLLLDEINDIIMEERYIPSKDREDKENRSSLIINLSNETKDDIRLFVSENDIRIRDLWVAAADTIIERYDNV